MTYVKVNDELDLAITEAEPIYQGENFSKSVTFIVPKIVSELDIKSTIAYLVYIRADGHPDIVYLEREEEDYNDDYYQYIVPIPETVTRYPGEIVFWLEFFAGLASNPTVLRTGTSGLHIIEHPTVTDSLTDSQVTAIYQLSARIIDTEDDVTPTYKDVILF